jgi:hypothetical protein
MLSLEVVSQCCFHLSFQVRNAALVTEEEHIDVAKKIIIRARLCATGCGSVNDLGNIKMMMLCTKADGNCIHLLLFSILKFPFNYIIISYTSCDILYIILKK